MSNKSLQKDLRSADPRRSSKQRRSRTMPLSFATPRGKTNRVPGRRCAEGRTPTASRLSLLRGTKGRSLRAAKWTAHISQCSTRRTSLNAATSPSTRSSWQLSGATAARTSTSRTKPRSPNCQRSPSKSLTTPPTTTSSLNATNKSTRSTKSCKTFHWNLSRNKGTCTMSRTARAQCGAK